MTNLIALAEKVESLTGPCRETDREIELAFPYADASHLKFGLPQYTGSLDAAMTLVPEGWRIYSADFSVRNRSRWMIEGTKTKWATDEGGDPCAGDDWYASGVAATPALALTAAALRSHAAQKEG